MCISPHPNWLIHYSPLHRTLLKTASSYVPLSKEFCGSAASKKGITVQKRKVHTEFRVLQIQKYFVLSDLMLVNTIEYLSESLTN